MRKFILGAIFLVGACATPKQPSYYAVVGTKEAFQKNPSFVTKYGIKVYCHTVDVTLEELEKATDIFVQYGSLYLNIDQRVIILAIQNSQLEWTSSGIYARDYHGTDTVSGAVMGKEVTVVWYKSISASSLYHEWLHLVITMLTDEHDTGHKDPFWKVLPKIKEEAKRAGL